MPGRAAPATNAIPTVNPTIHRAFWTAVSCRAV